MLQYYINCLTSSFWGIMGKKKTDNGKTKRMRQGGMQNGTACHDKAIPTFAQFHRYRPRPIPPLIVHCFPVHLFPIQRRQTVTDRGSRGGIKKTKTFTLFFLPPQLLFCTVLFDISLEKLNWTPPPPKKKTLPTNAFNQALSSIKLYHFGKQWAHSTWSTLAAQGLGSSN